MKILFQAVEAILSRSGEPDDDGDVILFNEEGLRTPNDLIEDLREALAVARKSPAEITVVLDGGLVAAVLSADERLQGVSFQVIDYDTDGADENDLFGIPQSDGDISSAYVSGGTIEKPGIDLAGIKPLAEFDDEEE